MAHRWSRVWCYLLFALLGCGESQPDSLPSAETPVSQNAFDPVTAGVIHGQVKWEGHIPGSAPSQMRSDLPQIWDGARSNANLPIVDPGSLGLRDAVVCLRGLDPGLGKPWDHPQVRIEHRNLGLQVHQGDLVSRIGFVHRGDSVEIVSHDTVFHVLQARGAAFFSLPLADADQASVRRLTRKGLVALRSGAGFPEMRGFLFVDDHPYYARTDSQGRFRLEGVPPGKYQIACWLPNWNIVGKERDPETAQPWRFVFAAPLEQEQMIIVKTSGIAKAHFILSAKMFAK